jgi:hypothetical protein
MAKKNWLWIMLGGFFVFSIFLAINGSDEAAKRAGWLYTIMSAGALALWLILTRGKVRR